MDNITHSLTGVLASKLSPGLTSAVERRRNERVILWLFILCSNLPDIDVAIGFVVDPVFSIAHHRGITHSVLFAPLFALFPALLFYWFSNIKNLKYLWFMAFLGILLHIFFDLITSFGTRVFAPISDERYALDWMFVVDPVFTLVLGISLIGGTFVRRFRRVIKLSSAIFVIVYLCAEMVSHSIAYQRLHNEASKKQLYPVKISVVPQPLSIFRWSGIIQTENDIFQTFFNIFDDDTMEFRQYRQAFNQFVARALRTEDATWYMTFARYPLIRSWQEGGRHVVEFRDVLFSLDEQILKTLGFSERSTPFVLRYIFSEDGNIQEVTFDRRKIIPPVK